MDSLRKLNPTLFCCEADRVSPVITGFEFHFLLNLALAPQALTLTPASKAKTLEPSLMDHLVSLYLVIKIVIVFSFFDSDF